MMRHYPVKKCFLMILASLFWVPAVCAEEAPILILDGPDVVEVGSSTAYTVTTQGGIDSDYYWWLGFTSNDAATMDDNGVLTANNPGMVGICVLGKDTGALAELHVDVVSAENSSVVITGPDKVVMGTKETFSAGTTGTSGGNYFWSIFYRSASGIATLDKDTGELTAIGEGRVGINATNLSSGALGSKYVDIVTTQKQTAHVDIKAEIGGGFPLTLQVKVSIRGDIPEDASLYVAGRWDGVLHYLPSFGTTMTPFDENPETGVETVYSVEVDDIPQQKACIFFAALLDSERNFISNIGSTTTFKIGGGR